MKFTDGCWLLRDGVTAHYVREAYEIDVDQNSLSIIAPTRNIRHRGDTLQGPTVTVTLSSPLPDVIHIKASHFVGRAPAKPEFEVFESVPNAAIATADETSAILTSGALTAQIKDVKNWEIEFSAGGEVLTKSKSQALGLFDISDGTRYMRDQLNLGVGEAVYGLGERFTAFVKNGQVVDTWNKDGGTNSDQTYKNVPFYLTNRGYGVFVRHPENVSFEIASEKADCVQFSVPGETIEYYLIYGPSPKEILQKYTALTGRPALPPSWSFGLWLTTSFTTNYDEDTVTSFIQGMAERDLPLHVFHFDCFWMREFHWCDFEWDRRVFPDPAGMLGRLKDRGLKICVWINPYIAQKSPLFAEGAKNGYLLKRPNGDVWQTDQWQPGMGIVDFTNPAASDWYCSKLKALLDMGVDAFKTDFGERIPTDVIYHDGSDPDKMHNYYSYLYNKSVFDLLVRERGEGEAVLFARSGTVGSQSLPVHWGGDCESTFEAMAASLRGGLSLGLSGFGFWSHDIGGFEGLPPSQLYKRWVAFGLLSSHSRLHGSGSYRVPWVYDDEAVNVLRFFTKLKCKLMPYLYAAAVEAHEEGLPMMRAMVLEFPNDPGCTSLERQYMLGESLLVAPVLSMSDTVQYYVPNGVWTSYLNGDVIQGPKWVTETHGFESIPLLVRPNSILASGSSNTRPDYNYLDGVQFEIFAISEGSEVSKKFYAAGGTEFVTVTAANAGGKLTVSVEGAVRPWIVKLVGISSAKSIEGGGSAGGDGTALLIEPTAGSKSVTVVLG